MTIDEQEERGSMFYSKEAMTTFARKQRKIDFEKLGSMLTISAAYYFGGLPVACVAGLIVVVYSLAEIEKLLNYQNFMKEKEIGLHDLSS